jgi:short-subunit dehydrogenase
VRPPVVVVTGASSGIGRATALAFAGQGAGVALAARRADVLDDAAAECRAAGGRAIALPTDVTDEDAVHTLAVRTVAELGRIDAWVNNAGVAMVGPFESAPSAAFRRIVETNLFGCVNGARAVLPVFRAQGGGVLINVSSMSAIAAMPYWTAYAASKHAVRGFSAALREELRGTGIDVCVVIPAVIDTPIFQHAANFSGRDLRAAHPVYPAEHVATVIVGLVTKPRAEVIVGAAGSALGLLRRVSPLLTDRLAATEILAEQFRAEDHPTHAGNLFEPMAAGAGVSGGWRPRWSPMQPLRILRTLLGLSRVP